MNICLLASVLWQLAMAAQETKIGLVPGQRCCCNKCLEMWVCHGFGKGQRRSSEEHDRRRPGALTAVGTQSFHVILLRHRENSPSLRGSSEPRGRGHGEVWPSGKESQAQPPRWRRAAGTLAELCALQGQRRGRKEHGGTRGLRRLLSSADSAVWLLLATYSEKCA